MSHDRRVHLRSAFRALPAPESVLQTRRERRRMLRRALLGRCPLCGGPGLRDGWARIHERCPTCNLRFSRERGYLVGAAWFNLTVALLVVGLVLTLGAAATAPDIPWTVYGGALLAAVAVPVLFQPLAVTLFLWVDLAYFRPLDAADLSANDPTGAQGP